MDSIGIILIATFLEKNNASAGLRISITKAGLPKFSELFKRHSDIKCTSGEEIYISKYSYS
jgi:hypothetical protein